MEIMKRALFILFFSIVSLSGYCSDSIFNRVSDRLYNLYVNQNFKSWKPIINGFHLNKKMGVDSLEYILTAQYCYVAWCVSGDTITADAQSSLNKAFADLERYNSLIKNYPEKTYMRKMCEAKSKSFSSAFLAFQMMINPIRVVTNGWKCVNESKDAVKAMPDCWFSQIEYGNVMQSMPTVLGGSKINARNAYLTAMKLMEADSNKRTTYHNWLYLHLLLCIADSYKSTEDYKSVRYYYKKILTIEPNFSYVRTSLMPSLDKYEAQKAAKSSKSGRK